MPVSRAVAVSLLAVGFVVPLPLWYGLATMPQRCAAVEPSAVAVEVTKDYIEFRHGKSVTARYHIAPTVAKPYFWPLNSPSGVGITRDWPMIKDAKGEKTD